MPHEKDFHRVLRDIAQQFPAVMQRRQLADIPRVAFHMQLAFAGRDPAGLSSCDVGGGLGLFVAGCAAMGARATLIDDFGDDAHRRVGEQVLQIYERYGVQILRRDVVAQGFGHPGPFDAVTAFGTLEHWHHSPKRVLHEIRAALRGALVIGTPNCLNLRKRIDWVLGRGYWSDMKDWYEQDVFRGHVREPSVADLMYIARDLSLKDVKIYGRNWIGFRSSSRVRRLATAVFDKPLRLRPSLCANIYLTGHTEASSI